MRKRFHLNCVGMSQIPRAESINKLQPYVNWTHVTWDQGKSFGEEEAVHICAQTLLSRRPHEIIKKCLKLQRKKQEKGVLGIRGTLGWKLYKILEVSTSQFHTLQKLPTPQSPGKVTNCEQKFHSTSSTSLRMPMNKHKNAKTIVKKTIHLSS
jgi:hypothetical protein